MKSKHLLSLLDLTSDELNEVLSLTAALKNERGDTTANKPLAGKTVAMIFSKSSTRTRVSFEVGVNELGGYPLFLNQNDLQLGRGETMADTSQVLSRYVHGVVIRTHEHASLEEYARHSAIPVINGLTDKFHPCQLLADLFTIFELAGTVNHVKVAYLGDGANNMANSWMIAAKLAGIELRIGAPTQYHPDESFVRQLSGPGNIVITEDPVSAVDNADFVYTDVWVSMGFESEAENRAIELTPYQVNKSLLEHAGSEVRVMHCLPAKRGKEITDDVLDGPSSIIWQQAENRLHAQKAVLAKLIS
jgi:ornithine carbamoyltransferase